MGQASGRCSQRWLNSSEGAERARNRLSNYKWNRCTPKVGVGAFEDGYFVCGYRATCREMPHEWVPRLFSDPFRALEYFFRFLFSMKRVGRIVSRWFAFNKK